MSVINKNKYTARYKSPDDIRNFKVRIRLVLLESSLESLQSVPEQGEWKSWTVKWRQKLFNKFEREFYSGAENCVTDAEKIYHKEVGKLDGNDLLFTYVSGDRFDPENEHSSRKKSTFLERQVAAMNLTDSPNDTNDNPGNGEFDYKSFLIDSIKNPLWSNGTVEKMFVMIDLGSDLDRNEIQLCRIDYTVQSNSLRIYPDFSTTQPYGVAIRQESGIRSVLYYIEHVSEDAPEEIILFEKEIFGKLKRLKNQSPEPFLNVPSTRLFVYLFFEIVSTSDFDNGQIYVQYSIDLPGNNCLCRDKKNLLGVTQTSSSGGTAAHFGHIFELVLEYDSTQTSPLKVPYIYFEVISRDSWDRYRTEGLSYRSVPVFTPGTHEFELGCFELGPQDVHGALRKFFVGNYGSYKDLSWVGLPQDHDDKILSKYGVVTTTTGKLLMRVNVVHQSRINETGSGNGGTKQALNLNDGLSRSVNEALRAFRLARKRMNEARRDF